MTITILFEKLMCPNSLSYKGFELLYLCNASNRLHMARNRQKDYVLRKIVLAFQNRNRVFTVAGKRKMPPSMEREYSPSLPDGFQKRLSLQVFACPARTDSFLTAQYSRWCLHAYEAIVSPHYA